MPTRSTTSASRTSRGLAGVEPARCRILRGRAQGEALARQVHRVWVDPPHRCARPRKIRCSRRSCASGTPVACIFGKSWSLHVKEALGVSLEENLELIFDTVRFLKQHVDEVVYDAEHFFDGYADNPEYALSTLKSAVEAGADVVVLCDTNGGTMPTRIRPRARRARGRRFPTLPSASTRTTTAKWRSLTPCSRGRRGVRHVQGTINGFGERCGNANLVSIIPNLQLKLGYHCVPRPARCSLKRISRLMFELLNEPPNKRQPYVGDSAFAHKGGVHVSAVIKNARTYEHVEPPAVGNRRRVSVTDLWGAPMSCTRPKSGGSTSTRKTPKPSRS